MSILARISRATCLALLILSFPAASQVTIRERFPISPGRLHVAYMSSTVSLATPVSGQIQIVGSSNLPWLFTELLTPLDLILLPPAYQGILPGNWKAGTIVSVRMVLTYPGEETIYYSADSVWRIPPYEAYNYTMHFESFQGNSYNTNISIVEGTDLDHFRVQTSPDSLVFGDTARITVTAVDRGDQEVNLGADTLLSFELDSTRLGSFLNVADSLTASPLTGIRYGDARAGRIRLVSTGAPNDSVSSLRMKVSETSNPLIAGLDTVGITDPFDVDIIEPASGVRIDSTISRTPSMPHLSSKARVTGRKNSAVTYYWDFTLKWFHWSPLIDEHGNRDGIEWIPLTDVWSDTLVVSNSDTCRSFFQWGNDIRGGFIDTLKVTAKCRARSVTKSCATPYRILGLNPAKSDVKNGMTPKMQVILYKESRFLQFKSDSLPDYGPPAGYGIAKMDPPTNDQQFWSWTANRAAGVVKFAGCASNAEDYGNRIRTGRYFKHWHYQNATDLDTNQQRLDAFQQYNGKHDWYWKPDNPEVENSTGKWYEAPPLRPHSADSLGYGRDAERIYQDILRGQYPPEWN